MLKKDKFVYRTEVLNEEKAVISVEFTEAAADELLLFSQDRNIEYHRSNGGGLLQGIAIQQAIGTSISMWKPGMGPIAWEAGSFDSPVMIGDKIRITLRVVGGPERRPHISFYVFNETNHKLVVKSSYTLSSIEALAQVLKRSRKRASTPKALSTESV